MNPAFPDIVGEWAEEEAREAASKPSSANDNEELLELLRLLAAKAEIAASRIW
jgi:hypothetical protein